MGIVLQGGTVVEFEPPSVEAVDLRIEGGLIAGRGRGLEKPGDEVIALGEKLVMPGLVCAHHHLYSAFARGMPGPKEPPRSFLQVLERIWWRLDQALDLDAVQLSAALGALDALICGTTTIIDHHASPNAIRGSLSRVARGVDTVGLRGVLAYEVTDRHGPQGRDAGLAENVEFARTARGRFRAMVGAHASFTLSDAGLDGLAEAIRASGCGLHVHLAEDAADDRLSKESFGAPALTRLLRRSLLSSQSVAAHAVHLSDGEARQLVETGATIAHNPTSNMNNQVGYAWPARFARAATLGTDGIGADMLAEASAAHFRAREANAPIDVLALLSCGHRLASALFQVPIGPLRPFAAADLVVLDYRPPTELTHENLAGHVLFGLSSRAVESVMVDGTWRLWERRAQSVDASALAADARVCAKAVWARMR